jgi:hypothetical protein
MSNQKVREGATKKKFDPKSPGFLFSLFTFVLTAFAASGISLPDDPAAIAGEITTSLSTGGIYAIFGVLITSVLLPLYNGFKAGKFSLQSMLSSTSTWIAFGTAGFAAIAVTGFVVPTGTVEQIVAAVEAKDWMGLVSIIAINVGNTLIRFLKDRNAAGNG